VIATTAGLSGQLMAQAAIGLLTGIPGPAPGYVTGLNMFAPDQPVFARYPPRDDCQICGKNPDQDIVKIYD